MIKPLGKFGSNSILPSFSQLGIGVYMFLVLFPLVAGLLYALAYSLGLVGALSKGFTLNHWQVVVGMPAIWKSFLLSLSIASGVVLLAAMLALATVLLLHPYIRKTGSLVFFIPLGIPPMVAAFWGFHLLGDGGLLARFIQKAFPFFTFPELTNDAWHIGVISVLVLLTYPFFCLQMLQAYHTQNVQGLMDIGKSLGGSRRYVLLRIGLPILWKNALPSLVLFGVFLFGAYEVPLLLGRQAPQMISVLIAQKFKRFDLEMVARAYVLTVLYAGFVLAGIWFLFKRKKAGRGA
ncbi:MAG: hypothetical protein R2792_18780 [Saprospiraceae bacterium]